MPNLIYGKRQISMRIVYAGPGLGGKTTNLVHLSRLVPGAEHQLTQIHTAGERTVGGDFLPVGMDPIGEWTPRLQVATVPGQVQYAGARELLLRNVDVIVFVADSLRLRRAANRLSLDEIQRTLVSQGRDPGRVPVVFQYNKRDEADVRPLSELQEELNPGAAPAIASVALDAIGVVETLSSALACARAVAESFLEMRGADAPVPV